MKLVVSDTNILIDLYSIGLLDEFFMLPFEIHTVDMVLNELREPAQRATIEPFIASQKLTVGSFDVPGLNEILALYQNEKASISFTDCSVWHYARQHCAILLSGDKRLRNKAVSSGIEVHGSLFLIKQMVANNIISPQAARIKLEELRKINPRLPKFG